MLTAEGKIDYRTLKPVLFEFPTYEYLKTGDVIGKCRSWGNQEAAKGGGQILLVTGGRGWYQEWGKPAQELHAGDVVNIPAGVKHWHGAAKDSWFVHLAVEVPGEGSSNEWLEPVTDEKYNKLP